MSGHEPRFAAAGRDDQLRPLTSTEVDELADYQRTVQALVAAHRLDDGPSFRLLVVGDQVLDGFEHGIDGEATLCGTPRSSVFVMRHLFCPEGRFACPACAAAVKAAGR